MNRLIEFVRNQYIWIGVAIGVLFIVNGIAGSITRQHQRNDCNSACWLTGATSSRLVDNTCICGKFGARYPLTEKEPSPALLAGKK